MRLLEHATDVGDLHLLDPTNTPELQCNEHIYTPIGALRARLLEETILDVKELGHIKGCPNRFEEAIDWIYAEHDDSPLSFLACCHALGIDPEAYKEAVIPQ